MLEDYSVINASSSFDSYINTGLNSFPGGVGSSDIITPKEISSLPATGAISYDNLLGNSVLLQVKSTITITASDATAAEILTGKTPNLGRFTLRRTDNTTDLLTVNYSILGTATNGQDYDSLTGSVTFAAGSSTAVISINPIDDGVYEDQETVELILNSDANYNLGTSQSAAVNLVDNDKPTVSISANDANAAETLAGEISNSGQFTLTRKGDITSAVTVNYLVSGTATNGQDYDNLTGNVTFAAGASTTIININSIDDGVYEGKETVKLILQSDANYNLGTSQSATVNLADDDKPTISISANDASAAETLAGEISNPGQFTLTRKGDITSAVTVNYLVSGTATNGQDYDNLTGNITFAAGSSTAVININSIDDGVYEGKETVRLVLQADANYNLGTSKTATVNLADNDKPTISISANDVSATETLAGETSNPGQFTLTRTGNNTASSTVSYLISGTATNGKDYDSLTGNVTFAAGSSTVTININPIDDGVYEGQETITLTLKNNSKYNLDQNSSASVFLDDPNSFINITSPNGGEVFNIDSSYNITWNDNIGDNVKIELYKGDSFYSTISESTISDGSEIWNVSPWILDGSDYSFKITSLSNSNLFDFSDSKFKIADWFSQSLQDTEIAKLTRALAADGELSRNDVMSVLRDAEDNDVVDANELADLKIIVSNAANFRMQDYVLDLSEKIVNGDLANQKYQGNDLGNLYAGSSNTQMENLISKWFLGSDRPQGSYAYQYFSQPLFSNGISPDDVKQGQVGDCYFLVTLAAIANEQPNYIQDMFIDNGDNTFTVRFFNKGVAEYVTVDRYLPTAWWGSAYANASQEMWVALAEKAYAQLAESGWSRSSTTNAYSSISSGWMSWVIPQVTGMAAAQYKSATSTTKNQLIELSNSNQLLTVGFVYGTVEADGLVNGHAYTITSYDAATDTFFLRNPWGYRHASVTWEQLIANKALFEWSV
jgi:Calpain family cysteine protease/Calx-beta domain